MPRERPAAARERRGGLRHARHHDHLLGAGGQGLGDPAARDERRVREAVRLARVHGAAREGDAAQRHRHRAQKTPVSASKSSASWPGTRRFKRYVLCPVPLDSITYCLNLRVQGGIYQRARHGPPVPDLDATARRLLPERRRARGRDASPDGRRASSRAAGSPRRSPPAPSR